MYSAYCSRYIHPTHPNMSRSDPFAHYLHVTICMFRHYISHLYSNGISYSFSMNNFIFYLATYLIVHFHPGWPEKRNRVPSHAAYLYYNTYSYIHKHARKYKQIGYSGPYNIIRSRRAFVSICILILNIIL